MSQYLIRRIETTPNIEFHNWSEVISLEGSATIERIRWRHAKTGVETSRSVKHLFVFIGATPSTKRVASAVGEGSTAVQYIHQFLAMRGAST